MNNFINICKELQKNNKFLDIAKSLKEKGDYKVILDRQEYEPYLERYYYLNLRPFSNLVIHHVLKSDIDGLHNHPWSFQNYILSGGYWEVTLEGRFWRPPGYQATRDSQFYHRLEVDLEKSQDETWTVFLMGPKECEWGFLDDDGKWIIHDEYLNNKLEHAA